MERHGLRSYHGLLLHRLCRRHARRRQVCRQGGARRGYLWAIGLWSAGACLHAFCGIATNGLLGGEWLTGFEGARQNLSTLQTVADGVWTVSTVSVWLFLAARCVLAIGESGNFPAAIKITAEYFPKKDRGFATSVFNSGAQIEPCSLLFVIPLLARCWGWEMSFLLVGAVGFVWMGVWVYVYDVPQKSKHVNAAELAYIEQDAAVDASLTERTEEVKSAKGISIWKCLTYRQTWAVVAGRFLPDGVWWFSFSGHRLTCMTSMAIVRIPRRGVAHFHPLPHFDALHHWWLPAHVVRGAQRDEPVCRAHACHAHLCLLPLIGLVAQP